MADSPCAKARTCDENSAKDCGPLPLIVEDLLARHASNPIHLVVFPGDIIAGVFKREAGSVPECNRIMFAHWRERMMPLLKAKISVRVAAGNHEIMSMDETQVKRRCGKHLWPYIPLLDNFTVLKESLGDMIRGVPGPESDLGLTYSFEMGGCHFAILNAYTMSEHNSFSSQTIQWLDQDLGKAKEAGLMLFVAAHPPAFPGGGHMWDAIPFFDPSYDCEGYDGRFGIDRRRERDRFWNILKRHNVVAYLCGHEHNIQVQEVEGTWQVVSGALHPKLRPLNGSEGDPQPNTILYDGAFQNPRASVNWPWDESRKSYWGWCLITVDGEKVTLEVFGSENKPRKRTNLRPLKTFVLRDGPGRQRSD